VSLLVTVTGPDHPGVTAGLFEALGDTHFSDVEQVVVHDRLLLGFVLETDSQEVRQAIAAAAADNAVDVEFTLVDDGDRTTVAARHHVTVLGHPLPPSALAAVARTLAAAGANIESIRRLSSYPAPSYELIVAAG
jgi:phosphoserine phosphatase